ncbi:MAG: DNA polymerase III subunit alpha [Leptospira sp.]|nr:DNA polymerase III subunit alpha [Leptospira sp.]
MEDFAHLHLHTTYSMLDGAIRIPDLVKKVKASGMTSVAMTDHGNMYGAIEFYNQAKKEGIKPILGCEFYVTPSRNKEEELEQIADGGAYHLILLVKNEIGYKNIIKLASRSFTEGFYRKARIDYDLLDKHSEGLVCLTACLAGEVNKKILEGKEDQSFQLAGKLNEMFRKEDFYLEIQNHGIPEQAIVARKVLEFSKRMGIKPILTNDSHFLNKDDQEAQNILLRIGMQKKIDDEMRLGFNSEFYVKTPEEMLKLFPNNLDAFYNTLEVRDKIDLNLEFGTPLLPDFPVPEGYNAQTFMEKLVEEGLLKRYGTITPEIRKRADFELETIRNMKFAGYFLIVQDYINFAKRTGIPVGPGRGSAAGSIVAYAIGITDVEPLRYNLLFERFLNPDRIEMPDIDTDFCQDRREEVINYIRQKYGEDRVGQIITFGSLAAKAALKDVARVFNLSFQESNEMTKAFPKGLGITLDDAVLKSPDLKNIINKNEGNQKIFQIAHKLEGNYRQPGRHAAGVVISPFPLEEVVPLATVAEKDKSTRSIVTQYDKNMLELVGLIKMDILGLKNLTTIRYCLDLIKKEKNIEIDIDNLPLDDKATYSLLRRADTRGIFQLESSGITDLVAKAQVETFEEIVALIALYRPGPMGAGLLDEYLNRKSGKSPVTYAHPDLEQALKETYGIIVYQEQVMSISRIMGGFTAGESDGLRKVMAKKKVKDIPYYKEKFINGAKEKGINPKIAQDLFDLMEKFAEYGFNKSHSVAYAIITYQTAYLKANFPTEYMAAVLATTSGKASDLVKYINNARDMGIAILSPDVNESDVNFSISGEKRIRFGLASVKGVGDLAGKDIAKKRKEHGNFKSLEEFVKNLDMRLCNKKVMESMIASGALDSFGYTRKCLTESLESIVSYAVKEQEMRNEGQFSLFGDAVSQAMSLNLPKEAEEWEFDRILKQEKELTGLYFSGHPLDKYKDQLRQLKFTKIENLENIKSKTNVEIIGIVAKKEVKLTKKNAEFVNLTLEDETGEIECVAFPKSYQQFKEFLHEDKALFIKGMLEKVEVGESESRGQIMINHVEELTAARLEQRMEKSVHIKIDLSKHPQMDTIKKLNDILGSSKGSSSVYFHLMGDGAPKRVIKAHEHYSIEPTSELLATILQILGTSSVFYTVGEELREFAG